MFCAPAIIGKYFWTGRTGPDPEGVIDSGYILASVIIQKLRWECLWEVGKAYGTSRSTLESCTMNEPMSDVPMPLVMSTGNSHRSVGNVFKMT